MKRIDYYSRDYHPQKTRATWIFIVSLKKGSIDKSRILNPAYNVESIETSKGATSWKTAWDAGQENNPWLAFKKWLENQGYEVIEGHTDPYLYPVGKNLVAVGEQHQQWVKFTVWK